MKRRDNMDGAYILTAGIGLDLAILDESGGVIARAKEVVVPPAGTLNVWIEIMEELPVDTYPSAEKEARIRALEAELDTLKNT